MFTQQPHTMTQSPQTSTDWKSIVAYAGTFLLIPAWDAAALINPAQGKRPTPDAPLRRLSTAAALGLVLAMIAGRGARGLSAQMALQTLLLLAACAALTGVLSSALLALMALLERIPGSAGRALEGLVWWGTGALALIPTGAAAIVIGLGALRSGLLAPAFLTGVHPAGISLRGVLLGASTSAALPAWITARAAWNSLQDAAGARRLETAAREAGITFNRLAGLVVGQIVLAEYALNLNGAGRASVAALRDANPAQAGGALLMLSALLAAGHLRALIHERAFNDPPTQGAPDKAAPVLRPWLVVLGLSVPFLAILAQLTGLAGNPALADPSAIYQLRSALHPLGTDGAGRDLVARIASGTITTWGITLSATLGAMGLGVLWGDTARRAKGWHAEVLHTLALGLTLAQPALIASAIILGGADSASMAAVAIGLALAPRVASGLANRPLSRAALIAAGGMALAAAFQISAGIDLLGLGIAGHSASLGTLWPQPSEVYAGALLAPGAGLYRLALKALAANAISTLGLGLIVVAVTKHGPADGRILSAPLQ